MSQFIREHCCRCDQVTLVNLPNQQRSHTSGTRILVASLSFNSHSSLGYRAIVGCSQVRIDSCLEHPSPLQSTSQASGMPFISQSSWQSSKTPLQSVAVVPLEFTLIWGSIAVAIGQAFAFVRNAIGVAIFERTVGLAIGVTVGRHHRNPVECRNLSQTSGLVHRRNHEIVGMPLASQSFLQSHIHREWRCHCNHRIRRKRPTDRSH